MRAVTKSLTIALGLSVFTVTGYLLYLLLKKEEDDLSDVYVHTSKFKTLEMRVPKDVVRSLIGRNGSNIKLLQEQSSTRIGFKDREGVDEKICVIRGSVENCYLAQNLIQEFINNQPVLENEDISVPVGCIRKIIGRNGDKINEIRGLSGAKLTVCEDDKGLTSKRISIKGTRNQINVARSLVEDVILECQHSQRIIEDSLSKREPRCPSKSPEIVKRIEVPKVESMSPVPGQPETPFEVYVSAMEDPSRFWLQIVGPKATKLDCLVEEMTEYYNNVDNRSQHSLDDINKGDLVAAVFQYDSKWYRAEILDVKYKGEEKMAELYYVDYGDTDNVPCKDLFELRTDFLRLHFQAIECYLARIEPVGESWSEEAIDQFEEWTHVAQWKKLSARINGYSVKEKMRAKREGSPIPGVDLFNVSDNQDVDIAEELVKAGHAVFKKGSDLRSASRTTSTSNISVASST
ncbi:tudor and KH domain-containing protein homolog isoform X2 [Cylas formicarius]|uniref:tudor and KH domain-containing protein homolog isoform X2 n=1 Tax=Cylas formicarius TaxID=197179 RepID=UPI002958C292|nr:tudor and KH domain-containing protein homolog isoform X2 [Cylas formicarius]